VTPRVAVLRGEWLNPFELQSYVPLVGTYDVFGIGARDGYYQLSSPRFPIVRLHSLGRSRVARRVLGDRSARLLGLERVLAGCAIVHSAETFLPISEQAAEARTRRGFKLILTCWENIPFLHDDDPLIAKRKRVVCEATDLFLAVTEAARQALLLENIPSERVVVQPVGVDRSVFRPHKRDPSVLGKWGVPDGWSTVLYCGRLIREKGVVDLVRAVAMVPRTVLVLVGEGPERTRLERAARAQGISERISFVGAAEYRDMPRLYANADVFCLPSVATPYWQEQFGMVLIEAMACGTAIVTTATGSIPEVVGNAAVLVPAYAPDQLAAALGDLLADAPRRATLAETGLQRVADRFDATKIARSIGDLYDTLLR
jgi:alpha-maltose-1-phosphate synthase